MFNATNTIHDDARTGCVYIYIYSGLWTKDIKIRILSWFQYKIFVRRTKLCTCIPTTMHNII